LSIGRRIERLSTLCQTLKVATREGRSSGLDWLLELTDSTVTYRSRYLVAPEWLPVLDLLLRDETNPRSILFQIDGILGTLNKIAQTHGACGAHLLAPLKEELLALEPGTDLNYGNAKLSDFLHRIQLASGAFSEQISVQFFSYTDNGQNRNRTS
jgi:uncharacterized alpha-E superfamily protein